MPRNLFDDRSFPGSRPRPWAPALGEGSGEINAARFADAVAGRRRPPPKKQRMVGGLPENDYIREWNSERTEQQRINAEMRLRAPGASLDRAQYMRDRRTIGRGAGHRGPRNHAYDPGKIAAAAAKREATWRRKKAAEKDTP